MQIVLFIISLTFSKVSSECSPKNVQIINFQNNPKRSKLFEVGAAVDKCPTETAVFHFWELRDITKGRRIARVITPFFKISAYSFNLPEAFTTTYELICYTSHYDDMRLPYTISKTFKFAPDEMHIEINGGPEIAYEITPKNRIYEIDAESRSYDKSFRLDENPFKNNEIYWTITPSLPGFTPSNNLKLKIPASHLKENNTYEFTVTVTRKKIPGYEDIKSATQIVRINTPGASKIKILCLRNCNNPVPAETSIFRVVCFNNCRNTIYEWYTKPRLDKNKTNFGTGFTEFVISGGACKLGDKVDIFVKDNTTVDSYSLVFEQHMSKGMCTIDPKNGTSGLTLFKISCFGFSTTSKELQYIIHQVDDEKGVIINIDKEPSVSNILLSPGNPAKIVIEVHDDTYEIEKVELEVDVVPLILFDLDDVLKLLGKITHKKEKKSVNSIIQSVSYLLEAGETVDWITDLQEGNFHYTLAEILETIELHDFDSSRQMLLILQKLENFRREADTKTAKRIGKCAVGAAVTAYNFTRDHNVPFLIKKELMEEMLDLSSRLLEEDPALIAAVEMKAEAHDYDSYDDMLSTKMDIIYNMRETINSLCVAIETLGIPVLDKNIPDQKAAVFQTDLITLEMRKIKKSTLRENQIISLSNNTNNRVTLPKSFLQDLRENFVDYQFGVLQNNPFYWNPKAELMNTDIVLFELLRKNFKIKNKQPFDVHLQIKNVPTSVISGNLINEDVIGYRIQAQPGSLFIFEFKNLTNENFRVATSSCYCNEEDFKKGLFIKGGGPVESRILKVKAPVEKDIFYFCIKKQGKKLKYEVAFATFSCLYWDLKTKTWNDDSLFCVVKNASLSKEKPMVCSCNHSSFFVGKIAAPLFFVNANEKIYFKIVPVKNWYVFTLLITVMCIWALLYLLAFHLDRKFLKRNIIHKLDDDVPGDSHLYMLVVFTGALIDAGTTADVAFQLIGEKSKSRIHIIKCTGVKMLQRNGQDWFVINTPFFLGDLKSIQLWHNCRGTGPHWYCKRIIVQHLKSGAQYCFIVENWFSLFWGNGEIHREIFLNNSKPRKLLFIINMETQFKNRYLLMSVFLRDSQSNFTSLERVGVLSSAFFVSMLASAMLYGFPSDGPSDSINTKPNYFLTFNDLLIFLGSWLAAIPLGVVVLLLFRNSAPRIKELKQ